MSFIRGAEIIAVEWWNELRLFKWCNFRDGELSSSQSLVYSFLQLHRLMSRHPTASRNSSSNDHKWKFLKFEQSIHHETEFFTLAVAGTCTIEMISENDIFSLLSFCSDEKLLWFLSKGIFN